MKKKIKKVLVANRGEIAVRIIRALKELEIQSVAVYSDVDETSLHVQLADEAVHIGGNHPLESYLNIDRIIQTAKTVQAEAIHPGYGFLAENPNFVERCEKEGLIFIGPPSKPMRLMGNKIESRQKIQEAGIPVIPGRECRDQDITKLERQALEIGLPVLIKASSGGGGKGMRIVDNKEKLTQAIESAKTESYQAFGDSTVYIEKFIERPRHIEFQILADKYGKVIHLFERECSIQRRHQKIIEETPSYGISPQLRKEMGQAAVKVAKVSGYQNAGTVEFLLDTKGRFYFLEMNARIQVEHPITELVTGVDLVKWQIKIAQGEELTLEQSKLSQRGHAIECRIYAEDPSANFIPCPGRILLVKEPTGPGVRIDGGIKTGDIVTPYYDPILSKLIVWAEDRESARKKMILALEEYVILGITTCLEFLKDIMTHPEFIKAQTFTDFISVNMSDWQERKDPQICNMALQAAAIHLFDQSRAKVDQRVSSPNLWQTIGRWEIGSSS